MKTNSPTHEEISQRAREIWQKTGSPAGRDTEIWLEAEKQLSTDLPDSGSKSDGAEASRTVTESKGASALAERIKAEAASESAAEFHLSPPGSDDQAIKAALQKKEARAPMKPNHTAPKGKPAESGKPLWDKPHSS